MEKEMFKYKLLIGENFIDTLVELVRRAEKRVVIVSYIASLIPAVKKILYMLRDFEGEKIILLNGVGENAEKYNKKVKAFAENLGVKVYLSKKFNHLKLYIIDDHVVIGSHNLSGSALLGREEISVLIKSGKLADHLTSVIEKYISTEEMRNLVIRDADENVFFEIRANTGVLSDIFEKTSLARERVKIMMYIATVSKATKRYYLLLKEKEEEGLDVKVILNGVGGLAEKYNTRTYGYMKAIGLRNIVLSKDFIHAKLFIIDDAVILGSHNLTSSSIAGRYELDVIVVSKYLARALNYYFESMFKRYSQ